MKPLLVQICPSLTNELFSYNYSQCRNYSVSLFLSQSSAHLIEPI